MTEYRPEYRRPIADVFRKIAYGPTALCVRLGVTPNSISMLSIGAAAAAAICFWQASRVPVLLWIAPLFCYLRLYFNMLDGMVAVAGRTASARGEVFNDLPDRVSDVLIFVSVAVSGFAQPALGYLSAIGALFVAYTGVLGQAVGVQREFSGVMSKQWRMMALHIGAWAQAGANLAGWMPELPANATLLDLTLLFILLGCVQSVAVRLKRIFAALDRKAKDNASS